MSRPFSWILIQRFNCQTYNSLQYRTSHTAKKDKPHSLAMEQLPCSVCLVVADADCVECSTCTRWIHRLCVPSMDQALMREWSEDGLTFTCPPCALTVDGTAFHFSSSLARLERALQTLDGRTIAYASTSETLLLKTYDIRFPAPAASKDLGPVDAVATRLLEVHDPQRSATHSAHSVFGDGNCLYRAVSRALYGHEGHHVQIRLSAALEVLDNSEFYNPESDACTQLIDNYSFPGDTYLSTLQSVLKPGAWGGLPHMYAISAALGLQFTSYCPPVNNADLTPLSREVVGRGDVVRYPSPLVVMWSRMTHEGPFWPNHFVVLGEKTQVPQDFAPTRSSTPRRESIPTPAPSATFGSFEEELQPSTPRSSPSSFDLDVSFTTPTQPEEPELQRPMPREAADLPTCYEVLRGGTRTGTDMLSDSSGFLYVVKRRTATGVQWRCSLHRTKKCLATVTQCGGTFRRGPRPHNHDGEPGSKRRQKMLSSVKDLARNNRFRPTLQLVEEATIQETQNDTEERDLPSIVNLTRVANRARAGMRPKHPEDLTFELDNRHAPPAFIQADVRHGDQRHLIMASLTQLRHLTSAKVWYIDATFKVVRDPFHQLLSIHSFLRVGDTAKQVPLAFVLMSRRKKSDYRAVLEKLLEVAGATSVEEVVCDFEQAMWNGIKAAMPDISIKGCSFHWSQAIFRKIKEVGLATAYFTQPAIRELLQHLMGVNHMPESHITPTFNYLLAKCPAANEKMVEVFKYFEKTWVKSNSRPPSSWSVYKRKIRTNNHVEGWHYRLNTQLPHDRLNIYQLMEVLAKEASLLPIHVQLLSQGKLYKRQRRQDASKEALLKDLWVRYDAPDRSMSTEQYLSGVADLIGFRGLEV